MYRFFIIATLSQETLFRKKLIVRKTSMIDKNNLFLHYSHESAKLFRSIRYEKMQIRKLAHKRDKIVSFIIYNICFT